ncbi:MAG: hypothetical protein D6689_09625 [Deltaproteobacteria bacterium]|nr:MAG: hypothetical protein D6689_09625 [Deltaproteobacteria bacterium]
MQLRWIRDVLGLTVCAVVAAACGGDDEGSADAAVHADAAGGTDAASGTDAAPAPDAAAPDAAAPDAAVPDAAAPDAAPPGLVTVVIRDGAGAPVAGVDVLFSAPDGTAVSHKQTDAAGTASETLAGGSMVTVAVMEAGGVGPTRMNLFTLGDVQPGDAIVIDGFGDDTPQSVLGTVSFTWPAPPAAGLSYHVTDGCNTAETDNPSAPTDLDISSACGLAGGTQYHAFAQAVQPGTSGANPDAIVAYSLVKNQPVSTTDVTLPDWSTAFASVSVDVVNAPAGAFAVVGDGAFTLDGIEFDPLDNQVFFGGTAAYQLRVPAVAPASTRAQTGAIFGSPAEGFTGGVIGIADVAGVPDSITADFAQYARPATSGTFDTTDPARPVIGWTASGTPGATDFTQVNLSWSQAGEEHHWLLVTNPAEVGPVQLPEMPAALAAYAPSADAVFDSPEVAYLAASWITDDWDTLRQRAGQPTATPPATDFTLSMSFPVFPDPSSPARAPDARSLAAAVRSARAALRLR